MANFCDIDVPLGCLCSFKWMLKVGNIVLWKIPNNSNSIRIFVFKLVYITHLLKPDFKKNYREILEIVITNNLSNKNNS